MSELREVKRKPANPYHVPIPVRMLAVPIGAVAIWLAAADLMSGRFGGILEGIGTALLALYCFYCAVRGLVDDRRER